MDVVRHEVRKTVEPETGTVSVIGVKIRIRDVRNNDSEKATGLPDSGEQIHQLIYALKDELGGKPELLFKAIYLALLGKTQGPRAGWFLSTLDSAFVKQRFAEAAAARGDA